ncbi:MAG: hypothetical protein A2X18_14510 [Bacteroidetes bacterium GWF2_40_14]|nr:MAG: hypothetical protein A2X18_14510 [Bacteroidetes bacterium GWF2_40_14]
MRKLGIILSLLSIIILYNCSDDKKNLKVIDLQKFNKDKIVSLEDRYNEYFKEYKAVFLEKTDSFSQNDVKQIISIENEVYILVKNKIRRYNLITGLLDVTFQTQDANYDFISFDIDRDSKIVYALEAKSTKIISQDTLGKQIDEIKLDPAYKYDKLVFLDKTHLLLTTCSLPVPVTFVADLREGNVKQIDYPSKKSFTPDKELYDTILSKIAPVNIITKSDSGVLVKYLFEDIVYRYKFDTKDSVILVNIDKANRPKLIKKKVKSKAGQMALTGLWQLSEDKWLVRWNHEFKHKEKLITIKLFTICNNQMEVYNNTVSYNTTIMEWYLPGTVFSIGAYDLIYINSIERKLFKVMNSNLPGINLPPYLAENPTQNNLILCYFILKNDFNQVLR